MKVWRVISTTFIALMILGFLSVSAAYFVLENSVLDSERVETALAASPAYTLVRDQYVIPTVQQRVAGDATFGAALTQTDFLDSLRVALPEEKIQELSNSVLDATYLWVNKKSPDIELSVSLADEKQVFLDDLSGRVSTNLAKLPVCRAYSVTDTLADIDCISPYATRDEYRDEIMQAVRQSVDQVDTTVTAATLGLDRAALGPARNIPDYVSYLWTLNLVTLPFAVLLSLYLIAKRRGVGMIVVGIVIGMVAVSCYALGRAILSAPLPPDELLRTLAGAGIPLITVQLQFLALWGGAASATMIVAGVLWISLGRKRRQSAETVPIATIPVQSKPQKKD